jgi:hypothetical protein
LDCTLVAYSIRDDGRSRALPRAVAREGEYGGEKGGRKGEGGAGTAEALGVEAAPEVARRRARERRRSGRRKATTTARIAASCVMAAPVHGKDLRAGRCKWVLSLWAVWVWPKEAARFCFFARKRIGYRRSYLSRGLACTFSIEVVFRLQEIEISRYYAFSTTITTLQPLLKKYLFLFAMLLVRE